MKNKILWGIEFLAISMAMIFACAMDSDNVTIPIIGIMICFAWMYLFAYANDINRKDK